MGQAAACGRAGRRLGEPTSHTIRNFTGHEQLDEVGLIHMNGRVYDPLLGRFGTPDPMTENPFSTQGWNRYSLCRQQPVELRRSVRLLLHGLAPFKVQGAGGMTYLSRPLQRVGGVVERRITSAPKCLKSAMTTYPHRVGSATKTVREASDIGRRAALLQKLSLERFQKCRRYAFSSGLSQSDVG